MPIRFRCSGATTGMWDPDRLLQVVSNLLGNALQYGAEGPIDVQLDGTDVENVVLTVANDGLISPGDRALLFDPFRSGRRGHDVSAGLGLGLYIVQQIVQAHDAVVRVESLDRTLFEVTMPRTPIVQRVAFAEHIERVVCDSAQDSAADERSAAG